jgi:hypothetical protein
LWYGMVIRYFTPMLVNASEAAIAVFWYQTHIYVV